jgi:hypothetical protein
MPFIALIVDAIGGAGASVLAVIGSMGAVRALFVAWRLIRMIRASRN